ncbi:MAG: (2Fe-2S)-binding protein [Candidatus Heimdallarchaeota archaeon]
MNGRKYELETQPARRLLDILREDLHLTGTKEGCGEGECGVCTVLLDGFTVNSCLVIAAQISGATVETIENPIFDPIRAVLIESGGIQCGFCTPGIIITSHVLLQQYSQPTMQQIRRGLAGNLCRCTGYTKIFQAIELIQDSNQK